MTNRYRLVVRGFKYGLNAVLNGFKYDYRSKRFFNNEKRDNDFTCINGIRQSELRKVKIEQPIVIHYNIFWRDKRSDRMNVASAFDKSFQDALQKAGVLHNDGWRDVINATFDFQVDKDDPRVEIEIELLEPETENYDVYFMKDIPV